MNTRRYLREHPEVLAQVPGDFCRAPEDFCRAPEGFLAPAVRRDSEQDAEILPFRRPEGGGDVA